MNCDGCEKWDSECFMMKRRVTIDERGLTMNCRCSCHRTPAAHAEELAQVEQVIEDSMRRYAEYLATRDHIAHAEELERYNRKRGRAFHRHQRLFCA
jgi:hypothetical protein